MFVSLNIFPSGIYSSLASYKYSSRRAARTPSLKNRHSDPTHTKSCYICPQWPPPQHNLHPPQILDNYSPPPQPSPPPVIKTSPLAPRTKTTQQCITPPATNNNQVWKPGQTECNNIAYNNLAKTATFAVASGFELASHAHSLTLAPSSTTASTTTTTSLQGSHQPQLQWVCWRKYSATPTLTFTTTICYSVPSQWIFSFGEQKHDHNKTRNLINL